MRIIGEQKVISASCIYNARRDRKRRQVMFKFWCGSTQWRTPRRIIKQFITRATAAAAAAAVRLSRQSGAGDICYQPSLYNDTARIINYLLSLWKYHMHVSALPPLFWCSCLFRVESFCQLMKVAKRSILIRIPKAHNELQ
jgi:hypothetical protein